MVKDLAAASKEPSSRTAAKVRKCSVSMKQS